MLQAPPWHPKLSNSHLHCGSKANSTFRALAWHPQFAFSLWIPRTLANLELARHIKFAVLLLCISSTAGRKLILSRQRCSHVSSACKDCCFLLIRKRRIIPYTSGFCVHASCPSPPHWAATQIFIYIYIYVYIYI